MPYVYRHIRLDKNEPFYIGIGKQDNDNYFRAKTIHRRNKIWNGIVNRTEYQVEIILDNLSWNEACKKETEFIKLYGRINLKTGCLCNLTDGGDGAVGYVASEESKRKIGEKSKGRLKSNEQIEKWKNNMNFEKSLEVRDKIRKTLTGKKHSEERKRIESISHIGIRCTEKAKEKLSENCQFNKKQYLTINNELLIFNSIEQTIKYLNISRYKYATYPNKYGVIDETKALTILNNKSND